MRRNFIFIFYFHSMKCSGLSAGIINQLKEKNLNLKKSLAFVNWLTQKDWFPHSNFDLQKNRLFFMYIYLSIYI